VNRRNLKPGDFVLGLTEAKTDASFRNGIIIGIKDGPTRESHLGCHTRIYVMWSEPPFIGEECDCGLLVLGEVGL
jgi:hypothetical protein